MLIGEEELEQWMMHYGKLRRYVDVKWHLRDWNLDETNVLIVSIFPLRRHKRCPGRLGYGGLDHSGNDRDSIGDLSDQNERRKGVTH